jgi:GAF domain-containing protein
MSFGGRMEHDFQSDIDAIQAIAAVPKILAVISRITGMQFAVVARVTPERWVCLAANDQIGFRMKVGGELKIETTLCHEVCQALEAVVIDQVAEDEVFVDHPTPAMYGFQSYISVPIVLGDGSVYGTLCALDPKPAKVTDPGIIGMFHLYAGLIATHLDLDPAMRRGSAHDDPLNAKAATELREQFMAALGHDLRTQFASIAGGIQLLKKMSPNEQMEKVIALMDKSAAQISVLLENLLDLARSIGRSSE